MRTLIHSLLQVKHIALCGACALAFSSSCEGLIGADFDRGPDVPENTGSTTALGGAGSSGVEDTAQPTVVSVSPSDGETGIRGDASIVVTFSDAMNREVTEGAYRSLDLLASEVTFSWNEPGTVLTIEPKSPLPYANGDETTTARRFVFSLDGAEDSAGHELVDFSSSFSTLRHVTQQLKPTTFGCVRLYQGQEYSWSGSDQVGSGGDPAVTEYRNTAEFPFALLPDIETAEIESAVLEGVFTNLTDASGFGLFGPLSIGVLTDPSTPESKFTSMSVLPALASFASFGTYSVDVTTPFKLGYGARSAELTSIWFGYYFPGYHDGVVARVGPTAQLVVKYLAP